MKEETLKRFDIFWKHYPRKVGVLYAKKIWVKNDYDDETLERMLEALSWQKQLKQWQDKQHIPHPSTWLNQGRWYDEKDEKLLINHQETTTTKGQKDELLRIMAEKTRKMRGQN